MIHAKNQLRLRRHLTGRLLMLALNPVPFGSGSNMYTVCEAMHTDHHVLEFLDLSLGVE